MAPPSQTDWKPYITSRISPGDDYDELLDFPRYFEMETVNACNARCVMCPLPGTKRKPMSDGLFEKIAGEMFDHARTIKRVALYRDGEPLMDPKLPQRIQCLKDGGIRRVGISTNVSLLTRQRAEAILKAGIDEVILSIDSLDKTVFENIRRGLVFETVLKNALNFIELRHRFNSRTQIWVRMVRQETNQSEWPAYEAFWKEKLTGSDRVNYHDLHNWGGQLETQGSDTENTESGSPCVALWSLMAIFSDGTVPLCNVDFNAVHRLGSLRDQSIQEIWTSKKMNRIRQMHLDGRKAASADLCRTCNAWTLPSDMK